MLELDPDVTWSQEGPTLSNDIWKKFELILTPPRSPLGDTDFDLGTLPDDLLLPMDLPLLEGDELDVDLNNIDLEDFLPTELDDTTTTASYAITCAHGLVQASCNSCTKLALAGSELRHDCMWQGTCTAEAHTHHQPSRTHKDSCSHITDILMDSSGALECVAGFTHLSELHTPEEESEVHIGTVADPAGLSPPLGHHVPRPDTPSESSETDTDEDGDHMDEGDLEDNHFGVCHEEEVQTSEVSAASAQEIVHIDHSYFCSRIPSSPERTSSTSSSSSSSSLHSSSHRRHYPSSSLLHTPSDSEDEIDVVSVGSTETAQTTTTTTTTTTSIKQRPSVNAEEAVKKVVKIRTGSLPNHPTRRLRKHLQHAMAAGVKRRAGGTVTLVRRSEKASHKTPKRLHGRGNSGLSRKRSSPRTDFDDPEKRHLHNTLERMRRVDLRNALEELRVHVPDLQSREKAPKVEILKKASEHCHEVKKREKSLLEEKERLRRYQSELRKRLHALQSQH